MNKIDTVWLSKAIETIQNKIADKLTKDYEEHKRSCPCWLFHTRAVELIDDYSFEKEYERILIE